MSFAPLGGDNTKKPLEVVAMTLQTSLAAPKVTIHNAKAVTTSQDVATYFGKLHKNVIQKIESLDCSAEFMTANFSAVVVKVRAGFDERDSKAYEMTKDGFVFLRYGLHRQKGSSVQGSLHRGV
uniref:Uncharacterized protein n=2 Tax=cellular organisms TaxID=131567 RepID=T1ID00_RHOPR